VKLLQALTEVTGEGGGMFDISKKMSLEVIFYWTRQAWEDIEQKELVRSRERLQKEKKRKLKINRQR
jgi:hypothetical protein